MPKYTVQQVVKRGYQIIARHPFYAQGTATWPGIRGSTMNDPSYDCSSFIGTINGVGQGAWPPATPSMVEEYMAQGYKYFKYADVKNNLKNGDVLVWNKEGTSGEFSNGHAGMWVDGIETGVMEMTSMGAGVNPIHLFSDNSEWQHVLRNPRNGIYLVKWEGKNS